MPKPKLYSIAMFAHETGGLHILPGLVVHFSEDDAVAKGTEMARQAMPKAEGHDCRAIEIPLETAEKLLRMIVDGEFEKEHDESDILPGAADSIVDGEM